EIASFLRQGKEHVIEWRARGASDEPVGAEIRVLAARNFGETPGPLLQGLAGRAGPIVAELIRIGALGLATRVLCSPVEVDDVDAIERAYRIDDDLRQDELGLAAQAVYGFRDRRAVEEQFVALDRGIAVNVGQSEIALESLVPDRERLEVIEHRCRDAVLG